MKKEIWHCNNYHDTRLISIQSGRLGLLHATNSYTGNVERVVRSVESIYADKTKKSHKMAIYIIQLLINSG